MVRPLCIKLPQMIWYAKYFDSNKTMPLDDIDKKQLKRILKYGKKISLFMVIMINT